jgi:hypothetical protein
MTKKTRILLLILGGFVAIGVLFGAFHRSSSTTSQTVNAAIDNLSAAGIRLLELPLILLLAMGAVFSAAIALPIFRWGTKTGRITYTRVAMAVVAGLVLINLALIADHKIGALQDEVRDLRRKLNQDLMVNGGASNGVSGQVESGAPGATTRGGSVSLVKAPTKRSAFLIDTAGVAKNLTTIFGPLNLHPGIHDEATDIVEVDIQNLPAVTYLAIVNLKTPGLEIKCAGTVVKKTLTSDFARENDCQIAINGEAGISPQANSGLGLWSGNMISAGKVLRTEDPTNKRPFLSFTKQNVASFTPMAATDRAIGADKYNVIWGRLDAIIDDKVQTENERNRQPRTAMAINKDGSRLYLLVVDGRQQRYSVGFTRAEVGMMLQVFGANNGMLCDEGGSSCMYLKKFNRIINSPSDGEERPTYSHFGITLHPANP